MASYVAKMQADGSLYGERPGAGVMMAADGVGTTDDGTSFRGVAYFQSQAPLLSALNGKVVVHIWEVDAAGVAA